MVLLNNIQLWNNIISVDFSDEASTKSWRQMFIKDFEGMYKRVGGTLHNTTLFTLPALEP